MKTAVAAPAPMWQRVIDALRADRRREEAAYMEALRNAALDPETTTVELARMIGAL